MRHMIYCIIYYLLFNGPHLLHVLQILLLNGTGLDKQYCIQYNKTNNIELPYELDKLFIFFCHFKCTEFSCLV